MLYRTVFGIIQSSKKISFHLFYLAVELNISFLSLRYLPSKIYVSGAEMNIDEYDPAITQIPMVNANSLMSPAHKKYMARITRKREQTVPNDLLMVCQRLSSNILPNNIPF